MNPEDHKEDPVYSRKRLQEAKADHSSCFTVIATSIVISHVCSYGIGLFSSLQSFFF